MRLMSHVSNLKLSCTECPIQATRRRAMASEFMNANWIASSYETGYGPLWRKERSLNGEVERLEDYGLS